MVNPLEFGAKEDPSLHPSLLTASLFFFPYFLFFPPIFLCLFHLRVFALGWSYPLYTVKGEELAS